MSSNKNAGASVFKRKIMDHGDALICNVRFFKGYGCTVILILNFANDGKSYVRAADFLSKNFISNIPARKPPMCAAYATPPPPPTKPLTI